MIKASSLIRLIFMGLIWHSSQASSDMEDMWRSERLLRRNLTIVGGIEKP